MLFFAKLIYSFSEYELNKNTNTLLIKINKHLTNQNISEPKNNLSLRKINNKKFLKENEIEITSATRGGL